MNTWKFILACLRENKRVVLMVVIDSKSKVKSIFNNLVNDGYTPEQLAFIHAPVGLPIQSHTPAEIAVSIAAEIIAVKNR